MKLTLFAVSSVASFFGAALSQSFNEIEFRKLVETVESDVSEFAKEVERLYATRCATSTLETCEAANYDHCASELPDQICKGGVQFRIPQCGDGVTCSGLYDYSHTSAWLPEALRTGENGNPTDKGSIETICFTRELDTYLSEKWIADKAYWDFLGVEPWGFYFGAQANGVFRMFPGQHLDVCGSYDPRVRPWYVAASSGPKNVVLVLDISANMLEGDRLVLMKKAATRVIGTLGVGDRVAIVSFGSQGNAQNISRDGKFYAASSDNKKTLVDAIEKLEAGGGEADSMKAFAATFDVFDESSTHDSSVDCNNAILFFSYGETSSDTAEVLNLIDTRISKIKETSDKPILFFTFSITEEGGSIPTFPSKLACAVEVGVWSKITSEDTIIDSLSSYYNLFALSLGASQNFVAWVEPYEYFSADVYGTTVSAPVYDRSGKFPIFLGVVGIDLSLAALDGALGVQLENGSSEESFKRVIAATTATCPNIDLSECVVESFRQKSSLAGHCATNCTAADLFQIEEETCPDGTLHPNNLWENAREAGKSYEERTCCVVGETQVSDLCPATECAGDSCDKVEKQNSAALFASGLVSVAMGSLLWIVMLFVL